MSNNFLGRNNSKKSHCIEKSLMRKRKKKEKTKEFDKKKRACFCFYVFDKKLD